MENWIRTIIFSMVLTGVSGTGFASVETGNVSHPDSDSLLYHQILYSILDLRFDQADSLLVLAYKKFPDDPEFPYLENYLEFLDAVITGNTQSFQEYQESSGKRIESIRDGRKDHAGSLFALSAIHLQSSLLCGLHNEMFRAAKHLYYSNRYLKQGEDADVGNPKKFRNRGLLILVSASVPEEYHWLMKVFGLRGGIEEGLGYLEEYYTFAAGADRLEGYLILEYAVQTLSPGKTIKDNTALTEVTGVSGIQEDPGIFQNRAMTLKLYSRALEDLSSGNSDRVIKKLLDYRQNKAEREFPYLNLLLGEALLNQLNPDAEEPLRQFSIKNTGLHYRHYVFHKLSWTYALEGEWENYEEARQKVLEAGETYLDADRQALSEAGDTLPLNIFLLKARLLFDGGDYTGALEVLDDSSGIVLQNERDSIEFLYRKARIFDQLGKNYRASEAYEQVIRAGAERSWYFAPNAALHLGMIHESNGDTDQALEYYRKCLKINKSSYKKSIDYKARAGIRRLDK